MTWLGWASLSAVFAAATAILAKIGVAGVDSDFATAVRTTVVVIFAWILVFARRNPNSFTVPGNRTWWFLIFSGLATGLSWLCYFRALQSGPASRVAPVDKLSVALVIFAGVVLLGEKMTWGKGIGGMLIVVGAIFVALD
jgi:transporter family protein